MQLSKVTPLPGPDRTLILQRMFDAPRELVFKAWSKPEYLARWWGPKDFTCPHCEADFRVGGKYKFCMHAPDGIDHWVSGEYLEILAPERLRFTWVRKHEGSEREYDNVVTVTFEALGEQTRLTLRQELFETTQLANEHQHGWTECLDRLAHFAETILSTQGAKR